MYVVTLGNHSIFLHSQGGIESWASERAEGIIHLGGKKNKPKSAEKQQFNRDC